MIRLEHRGGFESRIMLEFGIFREVLEHPLDRRGGRIGARDEHSRDVAGKASRRNGRFPLDEFIDERRSSRRRLADDLRHQFPCLPLHLRTPIQVVPEGKNAVPRYRSHHPFSHLF